MYVIAVVHDIDSIFAGPGIQPIAAMNDDWRLAKSVAQAFRGIWQCSIGEPCRAARRCNRSLMDHCRLVCRSIGRFRERLHNLPPGDEPCDSCCRLAALALTEGLPAEAGRFGEFVNFGLKSTAHEGNNLSCQDWLTTLCHPGEIVLDGKAP